MDKPVLHSPFFSINPKSYLYGSSLKKLAKKADELSNQYKFECLFTAQYVDLPWLAANCAHLIPCAQHMDGITPGRGMGKILPEALVDIGAKGTFLNHAEKPLSSHELAEAIERADELGILTIVCADSVIEAKAIAELHPDVMICEQASLIGTGVVAEESYMLSTNDAVRSISPQTKILQGAGIHCGQDVYDTILRGADGTGATSGIVCAKDPYATLEEMFVSLDKARSDLRVARRQ